LNYDNPEVRRKMIEATRYWVEEFDIDGYRFDAPWGMDGRNPEFVPELRAALKRIRPDILLLGEDKASRPDRFDNRWDVAYDWADGESWVSEWLWQSSFSHDSNPTIFNGTSQWSNRLRAALNNRGNGWAPNAKVLRFIENNDTFRFVQHHNLAQTRMAAALLFSLPGVPLIYNGQEVGFSQHPWQQFTIYTAGSTIESRDTQGFFPYYRHLVGLRNALPSLSGDGFQEITVNPLSVRSRTFAYRRWAGDEQVLAAINMSDNPASAILSLPVAEMGLDADGQYFLTDLFTGEATAYSGGELASFHLEVPAHTTVLLYVGGEPFDLPVSGETDAPAPHRELALEQNFPNPVTDWTRVTFHLPQDDRVRLRIFDILGREVVVLADEFFPAGPRTIEFDASALSSGVYVYVVETATDRAARRMTILR
jgi:hypothetical protein